MRCLWIMVVTAVCFLFLLKYIVCDVKFTKKNFSCFNNELWWGIMFIASHLFLANTSVNHTPSWMPPANPSTTMAPSMTPILKPSPLTQTPTVPHMQTVQIMKCSLGNNYHYGSNSCSITTRLLSIKSQCS